MSASTGENLEVEAKEAEPGLRQSRGMESPLLPIPTLYNRSSMVRVVTTEVVMVTVVELSVSA